MLDQHESIHEQAVRIRVGIYAGAARILLRVGKYSEAKEFTQKIREVASEPVQRAEANRLHAMVCSNTGLTKKAEKLLLEALEMIHHDAQATRVKMEVLYDLSEFCYRAGKMDQAIEHLQQFRSIKLAEENANSIRANFEDSLNSIRAGILEGRIKHAQGRFVEALELYSRAHEIAEQVGSMSDLANACNNLGNAARDLGDYPMAQRRFEEALEIWERVGLAECIAGVHVNLGNLALSQGDLVLTHEHHQKSLKAFQEIGNVRGVALAQINLAVAAMEKGDGPDAVVEAKAALQTLGNSENALLRGMSLVILGEGYLACEDVKSGAEIFNKVIQEYEKEHHPLAIAGAWRGLGRVALLGGELAGAIDKLNRALEDFTGLRREQEAARTALYRAEALWRLGDHDQAHSELQSAHKRFEAIGARLDAERAAQLLQELQNSD